MFTKNVKQKKDSNIEEDVNGYNTSTFDFKIEDVQFFKK